jgi:hypothetical protein
MFLAYLGTARHMGGALLWPAVALHAVVSFPITTWRAQHRKKPAASTSAKISG